MFVNVHFIIQTYRPRCSVLFVTYIRQAAERSPVSITYSTDLTNSTSKPATGTTRHCTMLRNAELTITDCLLLALPRTLTLTLTPLCGGCKCHVSSLESYHKLLIFKFLRMNIHFTSNDVRPQQNDRTLVRRFNIFIRSLTFTWLVSVFLVNDASW